MGGEISIKKDINLCLSEICQALSNRLDFSINRQKLIYLFCYLYLLNPEKFVKRFVSLAKDVRPLLCSKDKKRKYVLKANVVHTYIKDSGKSIHYFSKKAWNSNTALYGYIHGTKFRINKNKAKKLAQALGVPVDEIAEEIEYLPVRKVNGKMS